jgi:N-acetylglucosaminyldiphosphoundecaprenol N-acetyl-beta-D-mannosaminyltransferase
MAVAERLTERIRVCGMPLDPVTEREAIARIVACVESGEGGWVITPNLDQLRVFVRDTAGAVRPFFEQATLVTADGMGVVLAARAAGDEVPERVAGSTLVWGLTEAAADHDARLYLLGGDPGVAERAAEVFQRRWPQLTIAGTYSPPFGFEQDPAELAGIVERLRAAEADLVYVALGFPKQERLIAQLRRELPDACFLGLGITLSFVAGDVARAPRWMQRCGLEWIHRLIQEPRRLFRRYVVLGLPFAAELALRVLIGRIRRRPSSAA